MAKVHMKSAVERDSIPGKTRTLCGIYLDEDLHFTDNSSFEYGVTCGNCLRIIREYNKAYNEEQP